MTCLDIFGNSNFTNLSSVRCGVFLLGGFGGRGFAGRHLSDSVLLSACWFSSFGTFYPSGSRRSWNSTPPQLRFSHWLYNSQASRVLHKEAWYQSWIAWNFWLKLTACWWIGIKMGSLRFDPPRLEFPDESRLRVESRIELRNPMRLRHLWRGPVVQVLDAKGCFFLLRSLLVWHTPRKWTSTVTDATNFLALCLGVRIVAIWTWMALMDANQWRFSDVTWRKHWGIRLIGCAGGDPSSNSKEWGQNKEER